MKDISNPILAEYALYLEKQNIEYQTNNGFSVRFEVTFSAIELPSMEKYLRA